MTIVKLNKNLYCNKIYGRGIYGKRSQVRLQNGYGILDELGKGATKHVLASLGKTTGSFGGKQIAKLIQEKTGSKLLGSVAKSALGSLGGLAGQKLGSVAGNFLGNTVFQGDKDKKKKKPAVSLSELLDQARKKIMPSGNGLAMA